MHLRAVLRHGLFLGFLPALCERLREVNTRCSCSPGASPGEVTIDLVNQATVTSLLLSVAQRGRIEHCGGNRANASDRA